MTPLNNNDPYIDSTGKRSTLGAKIAEGGGGTPYELPTASANTKGGVKIGTGLSMDGEKLNATQELPAYGLLEAGKVLKVSDEGSLEWDIDGGAGGVYFEDIFTTLESGAHSYSKSFEITEAGTYMIRVCAYFDSVSVTINGVTQSRTLDVSSDYTYWYDLDTSLAVGDIIAVSGSASGKCGMSVVIVKTA